MFKKIVITIFMLILLVSCGEDTGIVSSGLILTEGNDFSISIPANWEIIKDKETLLPKPSEGNIELAVTSKEVQ